MLNASGLQVCTNTIAWNRPHQYENDCNSNLARITSNAYLNNIRVLLMMSRALLTSGLVENKVCNDIALVCLDLWPHLCRNIWCAVQ